MSFELGFYKDVLLNKLGAAKDRAAALLKSLDNRDVQLKLVTKNCRDDIDRMPVVRSRSKSKCKHSFSHEEERLHRRKYYDDWSSDDGYDTDCSCDEHVSFGRGRRSHRDADVYVDGGNAEQQNILVKGCCEGKCKHVHRRRPRSRSVIVLDHPRHRDHWYGPVRGACHPDGHCCIHGLGYYDVCSRCPSSGRMWEPRYHHASTQAQNFHRVIEDDGKMSFYDGAKLSKFLCDKVQEYTKSEADKKSAHEKSMSEAMGLIKKMCPSTTPNIFASQNMMSGGCGCGGHMHNCGVYNGSRSAQEIEDELAQVNADLDQLHARALLDAHAQALADFACQDPAEELTMCSGALQGEYDDVHRHAKGDKQKPLRSILARPKPKKVNFADNVVYHPRRIEEIGDDDDELSLVGNVDRCCSRCA